MTPITCYYCETTADLDTAAGDGWIPYFYDGEDEVSEHVCPSCAVPRLRLAGDGEYELIPASFSTV
jgi:hypothetical protein